MFTALLDSCVLWPSTQRDFLLSLAFEGAYRFIFSEAILAEVEANEEIKRVERGDSEEEAGKRLHTWSGACVPALETRLSRSGKGSREPTACLIPIMNMCWPPQLWAAP